MITFQVFYALNLKYNNNNMENVSFKIYCKAIIKTDEFAMSFTLYCCEVIVAFM